VGVVGGEFSLSQKLFFALCLGIACRFAPALNPRPAQKTAFANSWLGRGGGPLQPRRARPGTASGAVVCLGAPSMARTGVRSISHSFPGSGRLMDRDWPGRWKEFGALLARKIIGIVSE